MVTCDTSNIEPKVRFFHSAPYTRLTEGISTGFTFQKRWFDSNTEYHGVARQAGLVPCKHDDAERYRTTPPNMQVPVHLLTFGRGSKARELSS